MNMQFLIAYAMQFVGTHYYWSGDDPLGGFDCSGFASELMRAAGVLKYNERLSSQGLFNRFERNGNYALKAGALSFYGKSVNEISHVGFCLDALSMLEAGGGNSTTTLVETAAAQNAFVRIRPIRYRKDYLTAIYPPYPGGLV